MAESDKAIPPKRNLRRRRRGRIGLMMVVWIALLGVFMIFAGLSFTGRVLEAPAWVTNQIERRLGAGLGQTDLQIKSVQLQVDPQGRPRLLLRNVELRDRGGASLAQLNEVGAGLSLDALLRGQLTASALRVAGAQITVRRDEEGRFSLAFGSGTAQEATLAGLLAQLDTAFRTPRLAAIEEIQLRDLTITLEDARSDRLWQATGGRLTLSNTPERISINVFTDVFNGTEDLAQMQLSLTRPKDGDGASIGATLSGAAAQDIALQSPVLSYLGVIDAAISGAMRASVDADGMVEQFAATLEIGQGALQPTPKSQPIAFNSGQIYLTFDPAEQRIEFSQVSVQSDQLRVEGDGHAYLRDFDDGLPEALVAQLEFSQIAVAPEGLFPGALTFDKATADVRMRLAPFQLEIGQIALADGPRRYLAGGRIAADEGGWSLALDAQAPSLTPERLMQLWPLPLGPKTREWVSRNVLAGEISNIHAALRLGPGMAPRYGLSYDFQNAEARFLPNLPPITGGHGQSAIWDDSFSLTLHQGQVAAAEGGAVDLAGSTFKVADIHARPGRGDIRLKTDSSLTALLSVLSNRPFLISQRTGRRPDLAQARAQLEGHINVALKKNTPLSDVFYEASGTLSDVTSTDLVPGYTLSSRELQVELVTGDLAISGPILLDGLPLNIAWSQPLTPERASTSRISGQVELSDRFTDTFGIALPTGTVSGRGVGELNLEVTRDAPIAFSLRSDLQGVGLTVPSLRWSKAAESPGALTITGQLGETATIDRLAISGPGLEAEGIVEIGAGGGFGAVEFSRLEVGNWLNAAVRIEGSGARPGVRVIGGEMDIRNLDLAAQRRGASGGGPVSLELDRVIITDTIAFAPFSAQVTTAGGLNGTFKARVNGGAPIQGSLVPTPQGTAVRIISERAGAVARDAGFLKTLAGGTMDLILRPRKGAEGYDGRLRIRQARLRDQPAMAALLDAISVVGLLDEMNGSGISFETMQADFRLTSQRLYLDEGAAIGPSLGISLQGTYDIPTKELDMQGVISPVYILNGIGQIFSRPGEGLFGFNYSIRGSSDAPRLSVNPLSILTPGMFREIFRSAPPNLEE